MTTITRNNALSPNYTLVGKKIIGIEHITGQEITMTLDDFVEVTICIKDAKLNVMLFGVDMDE